MKLTEVITPIDEERLDEAVKRVFKRQGSTIKPWYMCTGGTKKGKYVKDPGQCGMRKNPKKVRTGRKTARRTKSQRARKSKITKNTAISKMVQRMNKRL